MQDFTIESLWEGTHMHMTAVQERLSARPERSNVAEGEQRKQAPFEDLRELIRKKRALEGGEGDEGRVIRPSIKSRIGQK